MSKLREIIELAEKADDGAEDWRGLENALDAYTDLRGGSDD